MPAARRSTDQLERMKLLAILLIASSTVCTADDSEHWQEHRLIYMTISGVSDLRVISEADLAIAPLGWRRDSSGTTYPGNLVPGIFASYKSGALAAAMLVQASRTGCMVFSASNYEERESGLVVKATDAVRTRFTKVFGAAAKYYSDPQCTVPL